MNKLSTVDYHLYHGQREMIKHYNRNLLKSYGISYQQYLVMMVLSEHHDMPVLKLGEKLAFQSGTITPILKKMEADELVIRSRSETDERVVMVSLAKTGQALLEDIQHIPDEMFKDSKVTIEEYKRLMYLMNKIVHNIEV
ncbi:MarR family transcriptional regulator [Macrococcus hajekii]|uniref:HTH-type transcriptional regulator SarZ n=1 Tax=Macrococcus hajekii TaxID=198482 RepID=A0A4R6BIQ1_9STAP|nr:MarR family transcriptional regulator [Macrococcus hajekii]TDM01532.1 MarR family transcriptional regulator [Macrococcus hajekii]GGB00781.1 MarR family transcriptional regulator [Macrococcus hajekii]